MWKTARWSGGNGFVLNRGWKDVDLHDNLFMIPGPVKMHPRVVAAMARPALGHRTAHFREINLDIRRLLQYLYQTQGDVTLISGSGTAALDSVFSNLFTADDVIVTLANGKFGSRLCDLADRYCTARPVESAWAPDESSVAFYVEPMEQGNEDREISLFQVRMSDPTNRIEIEKTSTSWHLMRIEWQEGRPQLQVR